mgnify:CR=1 FL=1
MGSVIIGSGRALPARIVTNDELSEIVDTTDEWIVPRTGIHIRHVAIEETCTDLGAQAALRALGLEEGGWQREAGAIEAASLDMIICPTLTADTHFPSEAARIRERIGATNAVCYDMSCACSGCVYGLSTADLIMAGAAFARQEAARTRTPLRCNDVRRVLVVAAERLSKLVDWEERATCILFGDGAAAAVYRATEDDNLGIQSTFIAADGSGAEYLRMEALPVEDPFAEDRTVDPKARFLKMQGAAVVRFTARAVPQAIDTALQRAGITADDIDWVVPHQANLRILDVIARRYHLPKEKVYVNMDRFGNTSSASVPICLNEMRRNGLLREGQTIVCTGFGGGLTYGAFVLKL